MSGATCSGSPVGVGSVVADSLGLGGADDDGEASVGDGVADALGLGEGPDAVAGAEPEVEGEADGGPKQPVKPSRMDSARPLNAERRCVAMMISLCVDLERIACGCGLLSHYGCAVVLPWDFGPAKSASGQQLRRLDARARNGTSSLMGILRVVRRYPVVAAGVAVLVASLGLSASGQSAGAEIVSVAFAGSVGAWTFVGMVRDMVHGRWGLDILAVTAIAATLAVGEYLASVIVVLMLTGGGALEDYAAGRAKQELTALLDRAPRDAHRELPDGRVQEVDLGAVRPGDVLVVRPNEVVPVDGLLISAAGVFDESSLTGESLPVERSAGDPLLSGSVNGTGAIRLRATATADESQFAQIVVLVRQAAESKAPVVRLADRYAVPFTVFSLVLAGLGWWLSGSPLRFAEVLVVATPCPLLIAAPVAFLGGMSCTAKNGVIVKGGAVLEVLSRVRTAAFDKTGTLTQGRPELVGVRPEPGIDADELLRLTASAEQYSTHALAASVVAAAATRGIEVVPGEDVTEVATNGVGARVGGRDVLVGKRAYVSRAIRAALAEPALRPGELAVHVAVDGEPGGVVVLRDTPRPEAAATLDRLRSAGVSQLIMLTGDTPATASSIADELGMTEVRAELLPLDKVDIVRSASPRPVLMVGDGVNDAPVLAAADVGIAMGARGSTAASESADAVVLVEDLTRAAEAVEIAQRTVRIALQSIWLGIALSVGLMGVALTGALPPVAGALLQELVDLATILNALRAVRPPWRARP
ncbi:heavy metal translocating P-type ATPase [Sinomonas sp. JGH33]|uniref:Heavy metal translocating P-type ATPase n=1 Tax=Sinomonas terricola TaxID=3110330 RepID=A0ABU5T158_9MICC|nr:heavy metal translocating P-type ATPase [Sinomonas sp. JGH33]MEA5453224.1 heavy metal translocating P-type ATPase [Sinomonas sp. JGH33]